MSGSESGSNVRAVVKAAVNVIATAVAMAVAVVMAVARDGCVGGLAVTATEAEQRWLGTTDNNSTAHLHFTLAWL